MSGGKHLLLLAAYVLLARCQSKPKVSMSPELKQIFSGDLFYLSCDNSPSGSSVKWYFNTEEQTLTNKTWKIAVANPKHSGSYRCESQGQQSDSLSISVLEYVPRASLTIKIGQPVMRPGGSVILQLDNDDGLQGWNCWVYRGEQTKKIMLRLKNDTKSLDFQPRHLLVPETVFWCSDATQQHRSNQVTVRTSAKAISLEMYPLPAVTGESLTLRCLVWGTDQITHTVFYKNNAIMVEGASPTHKIPDVTEYAAGSYKCDATFTHKARTSGPPYHVTSDSQDVFVQAAPMKAVLTGNTYLSCDCELCPGHTSYRWYHMNDENDRPSALSNAQQRIMVPKESGTYACRAVWNNGMSLLSNRYDYQIPINVTLVIVVIVLGILGLAATGVYIWYKKRNTTAPIYEDLPMMSQDRGGSKYEGLQMTGAQREAEYDTLQPEASREKTGGEYQQLKKEGMKEGAYHTLGVEGAAGGGGGYEALKKEGMKEGVYHTLGVEGAAGGEGGYEALKKEGMKEGVYHTLGMEGTGGAEGGYEAVGKDKDKEEKKEAKAEE